MVTVKEIAQMCNVSASTVSNVLNGKSNVGEEVRKKVLNAVEQTGYKPNFYAQNMRMHKSHSIGIIVEDLCQFSSSFIVETIMDYMEKQGYHSILMNLRMYYRWKQSFIEDEVMLHKVLYPVLQQMKSMKVDGIIYVAAHCRVMHAFPDNFDIPSVFAYAVEDKEDIHSIIVDDIKSTIDLMDYVTSMGHKKIGIIAGAPDNFHTKARLTGFQKLLFSKGILFDPDSLLYGEWNRESGYEKAMILLRRDITALWCMNDRMASGAYAAAHDLGYQVGKDISIIGFDNQELSASLYPALTTSNLPLLDIGYKAAQVMYNMLEHPELIENEEKIVRIKCKTIVRDSVCRI